MKNKKIYFNYKGKKINLEVKECGFFERFRGLMFRKKDYSEVLLFNFNKPVRWSIHSYFVFFDFLAVWLDDKNNIVDKRVVKPFVFRIKPNKKFFKLLEIPLNRVYEDDLKVLVER